ncbi:hypothetical protein PYW08_009172 [Mythimna loreyi]|uniref:Uncharacterized protein n=1 Tax=Mythimna loreyi TaxID=667449 RepID=A0ACC2Q8E6_9NEOP|nr:hypothetical protein PYW08_009172 [Mythimna loreyi]
MVEDTLKRFQLDFEKHIVATTSDGPNVMKKFGRESPSEMILCLNHAIHLGVVDTFYKKRQATSAVSSSEDTDDSDDEIMENKNSSDDEADDNASYDTNFRLQPIDEIKRVLDETRSLVKLFRKSPLKNSQLQNYVKAEFGKELSLLLDVKTRWNSIVMAERFLKLKNCVKKALIDLNMLDKWNEDNLLLLQSIVDLLQPVKIAVEALGRQNATGVKQGRDRQGREGGRAATINAQCRRNPAHPRSSTNTDPFACNSTAKATFASSHVFA